MRRTLFVVCALGLAVPASAKAAGGPVQPVQGGAGVNSPADPATAYVTIATGRGTVLERLEGNRVTRYRGVPGNYGIPGAALDGTTTGLSADGSTLVLAPAGYNPRRTTLIPVRTRDLRLRKPITLRGQYVVDAISPDARTLFLVGYPNGAAEYDVRAYDLEHRRMLAGTIVDPREPKEKLQGVPLTRVTSADGRWVYTLYTGGEENFIHALDTVERTAVCIGLDGIPGEALSQAKLTLSATTLGVGGLAVVDLRTFKVAKPAAAVIPPAPTPTRKPAAASGGGGVPWLPIAGGLVLLAALGLLVRRRRPETAEVSVLQRVDGHPAPDHAKEEATL